MKSNEVLCFCCSKQKFNLGMKKSSIIKNLNIVICDSCNQLGYEPRWVIIMAGRQYGPDSVKDYVLKKRYLGEDISASELLV